jgi:hypothetical protein
VLAHLAFVDHGRTLADEREHNDELARDDGRPGSSGRRLAKSSRT